MEWTLKDILLLVLGSGTFIGALVVVFNAITARLDARRKRIGDAELAKISNAVEIRQLQAEMDGKSHDALIKNLWKIIAEKRTEIIEVKREFDEMEQSSKLSRPVINQIYAKLRTMRREIDALNGDTRAVNARALLDEIETLLP